MLLLVRKRLNILLASAKFVHHTRSTVQQDTDVNSVLLHFIEGLV
jgi:hypothetical protein